MSTKNLTLVSLVTFLITAIFAYYVLVKGEKSVSSQKLTSTPIPTTQPQRLSILAENLDTPWGIAILPDGSLLVTERPGRVRLIDIHTGLQMEPVATLQNVSENGEGGLLGIALHPQFSSNGYVYLYYTYSSTEDTTLNRVVRRKYVNKMLVNEQIVIDAIPGAPNHNGGRIKFGPGGFLFITTGDAQEPSQAQNTNSLAGKILRVTDEGKALTGNPFNNLVYSYGHRNVQGLAWDNQGRMWATEHGRSGDEAGLDEINMIEAGKNYGWPVIQGNETQEGMVSPVLNSGSTTWAPSGLAYMSNSLYFGGLKGETLYKAEINGTSLKLTEFLKNEVGRIREVVVDSDGKLYITTSNRDSRGDPNSGDDKVIRIDPTLL